MGQGYLPSLGQKGTKERNQVTQQPRPSPQKPFLKRRAVVTAKRARADMDLEIASQTPPTYPSSLLQLQRKAGSWPFLHGKVHERQCKMLSEARSNPSVTVPSVSIVTITWFTGRDHCFCKPPGKRLFTLARRKARA